MAEADSQRLALAIHCITNDPEWQRIATELAAQYTLKSEMVYKEKYESVVLDGVPDAYKLAFTELADVCRGGKVEIERVLIEQ